MNRLLALPMSCWRAIFRQPLLALLNLAAIPTLALVAWAWLYLPDSNAGWIVVSLLVALAAVFCLLYLVTLTFLSYYRSHHPRPVYASVNIHPKEKPLFRRAFTSMPAVSLWFLLFGGICASLTWINQQTLEWSKPMASWITMLTQRPMSFYQVHRWLSGAVDFAQWILLPLLFLAFLAGIGGAAIWGGGRPLWLKHALHLLRNPAYWLVWILFLILSLWLPAQLFERMPVLDGIPVATASLLVRLAGTLALFGFGWLFILSALARFLKHPLQHGIVFRGTPPNPS
jgi:hypothetical protein